MWHTRCTKTLLALLQWTTIHCKPNSSSPSPSSPAHLSRSSLLRLSGLSFLLVAELYQYPALAEIDASLAKERDYITKITELSTSLNAFTDAYSRARDDNARKDAEITALENELQTLKVSAFPSFLFSSYRFFTGPRATCHLSLGR